jgi:protein CpxP
MERTKLLTFTVVGLLLLDLVTISFLILKPGRPQPPDPRNGPGRSDEPATIIIKRLHFDPDQQRAYQKLVDQHQKQMRILNESMAQLHRDYYGLLAAVSPDMARQAVLSQQIADNQKAQAGLNFRHFEQIKALCHPAQQDDFRQLAGELARLFGRHRPPRAEGGRHPEGSPENFSPKP